MKTLFINACVRENSRTLVLAKEVLKHIEGEIVEIDLKKEELLPLNCGDLERREAAVKNGETDAPLLRYARQFANADQIVIAAPFWDLSFPSLLKIYFEWINVSGITFKYHEGNAVGLCNAKKLIYVTTAGGKILYDFGYSYVKSLANLFYGIKDTRTVRAEDMDVDMVSSEDVLKCKKILVLS